MVWCTEVVFRTCNPVNTAGGGAVGGGVSTVIGTMSTLGQKHFYMETQTTMAVPGPGGRLTVNCATQCMSILRNELASVHGYTVTRRPTSSSRRRRPVFQCGVVWCRLEL